MAFLTVSRLITELALIEHKIVKSIVTMIDITTEGTILIPVSHGEEEAILRVADHVGELGVLEC